MKYLEYLIWIFGIIAGIFLILGAIDFVFDAELMKINHDINYFHAANSMLLVAICCTLYLIYRQKKEG